MAPNVGGAVDNSRRSISDNRHDPEKPAELPDTLSGSETERPQDANPEAALDQQASDAVKPHDEGPLDGGTAAWMVVLGAWCCSFCSPGWINSMGSFQEYYQREPLKDYSSSEIAWIPSLEIFFLFGLGPIVGIIFDRYGPRPLIIGGTIFHVFGLMMASLAKTYYQFLLSQGVCSAIGVACLYSPGSSVGGVIFPIMITRMIERNGYPWALRTAAFLILGLQVIACLTVRPRQKPVPKKLPAGRLAAPFTEPAFALLLVGIFILTYGMYIPIDYLPLSGLQEAHMSVDMSQYLVAIMNAASLFGRLGAGYGADIIGRWNMFIIACGVTGVSNLAVWIPATKSSITIGYAIMFGFASGAFVSLVGALPVSVSPIPELGYRMGIVFLVISIPALTMAPIGGAILQHASNGWVSLKVFAGVMCLVGSAIILGSRMLYTEKRLIKAF
ncbi:major facilitator superfamily transporter [Fusarium globosum]|uniref:Major facilitator superfamily transporter n=1 Tax=Fusarium globosum TaxID=78864 RepID=A0A8H5XJU9_9HYPO|nr:major facilitator superfamily transporter [Fusarium globosum]